MVQHCSNIKIRANRQIFVKRNKLINKKICESQQNYFKLTNCTTPTSGELFQSIPLSATKTNIYHFKLSNMSRNATILAKHVQNARISLSEKNRISVKI